jgi:hypothetical protein
VSARLEAVPFREAIEALLDQGPVDCRWQLLFAGHCFTPLTTDH